MAAEDEIVVTKLDAAQRQLRTAIALWFNGGDPVSTHTLVFAAHELIFRLFKNQGLSDLVFDSALIKPEYLDVYRQELKKDATFFKHANRSGGINPPVTFDTSMNYMFIVMSVAALDRMGELFGDEELAVKFWLQCHKPHLFTDEVGEESVPVETAAKFRKLSNIEFFKIFMESRRLRREQQGVTC